MSSSGWNWTACGPLSKKGVVFGLKGRAHFKMELSVVALTIHDIYA